jgi:hypothetical protein
LLLPRTAGFGLHHRFEMKMNFHVQLGGDTPWSEHFGARTNGFFLTGARNTAFQPLK